MTATTPTLAIDWTSCHGHGLCAQLWPERIRLDEWGYPMISSAPLSDDELRTARRTVAACPALALRLSTSVAPAPATTTPTATAAHAAAATH